ncbi:hypothetical protein DY000_02063702, partial [Brassica cretica]
MIRSFRFRAPTNHPGSSIKTDHSHRLIRFPTRCSSPDLSHYTVLGLTPFASQAEVKRAFKRLALKYHPDVQKGQKKDFKEIISAYQCLMQKFENQEEEEVEELTELDETDEWEEWMGFEGGIPSCVKMIRSFRFRAPTNHPGSSIKTDHSHRLTRFPTRCSSPDLSHYRVLGLTPFASQAEVKRAFKRLALKYHPDVQKGQEKDFKEIISAYE